MADPKVSVIMNCLNGERDLREALDSVKAQTCQDFEIIFWDNASTDGSASIAKSYGDGLRYFKGEKTVPLGAARNLALHEARGEYIAFLDCDDLWLPDKLEKQARLFEKNPRVGLVCSDTEIRTGKNHKRSLFAAAPPERGMAFDDLMQRQWISMSSAMARKSALDQMRDASGQGQWFDESLNVCEEADVFYRLAHDWELDYVPEALTVWRVHGANTTLEKFSQFAAETRLILAKHRKLYPGYDSLHGQTVAMLENRAAFQEAVSVWKDGNGARAREIIKPYLDRGAKNRLFWLASFLPGGLFNLVARLYFTLPGKWRS